MQLIIMRHGEAGSHSIDSQRELTLRGIEEVQKSAHELFKFNIQPAAIWASPYLRARQTASVASEILSAPILTQNDLTPDSSPKALLKALEGHTATSPLMLVSHMPFVAALTALLVDDNPLAQYPFATAQVRILDLSWPAAGCGMLIKELPAVS